MIRRIESVDMTEVVQSAVASTVKDYENLQREQMLSGQDSKGNPIGTYKSRKYAEAKHAMNPAAGYGIMDFKLTGDFQKLLFTRLTASSIFINSTDKKTGDLLRINKDVFGLNPEKSSEYSINNIAPVANSIIKRKLAGNGV